MASNTKREKKKRDLDIKLAKLGVSKTNVSRSRSPKVNKILKRKKT